MEPDSLFIYYLLYHVITSPNVHGWNFKSYTVLQHRFDRMESLKVWTISISLSLSLPFYLSLSPSFCVCLEAFGQWTFPFVGKKFMQMVWYGVQLYGNVVALLPLFCSLLFWTHTQFLTNSTLLCTSPPPFLSAIFASHQTFISSFSLIHMSWDLYLLSHYIYFTSIHLYITSPKKLRNSEYIIKNKGWGYILLYWNILVLEIQVQKQKIKVQHNKIKHKRSRNSA